MADKEAVSLAARVLSRGNPFTDGDKRDEIREALLFMTVDKLEELISPYIDDAMSLAGHILGAAEPEEVESAFEVETSGNAEVFEEDVTINAALGLLKGLFPAGVSFAKVALALGMSPDETRSIGRSLKEQGFIRIDNDGTAYATNEAVANKAIPAMAWPKAGAR